MSADVLVAHSAHWIGIARLPALLQAAGARVTVMCPSGSYLGWTRFAERRILAPVGLDAFAAALRAHLHEHDYRWVILADDDLTAALAQEGDDDAVARALPVTSDTALAMMASKIAFLDVCKRHDLPVSASETATTFAEAVGAAERIGYPVMLKLSHGAGGVGVSRVDDDAQLARDFNAFARGEELTVERFVPGLIAGAELLYDRGTPLCWQSYYKEKRWPGDFGPSAVRRMMTHPQVEELARRLGAITGIHGFAVLCFIHETERDRLVLLEMNFRPGTGMHVRGPIRRTFAAAVSALLAGRPYDGPRTPGLDGRLVHLFPQDLRRSITEHDLSGLLALAAGGLLQDLPYDDLRLLIAHLSSFVAS